MICHQQECLSIIGNPIMKLKLVLAISAFAAMAAVAQAKQGETPPTAPRPTMAQVQKVVQIISNNKTKLQQYCDIAKLDLRIAQAKLRNDTNTLEVLIKQADDLAEKIGPEYVMMMQGLLQVEENSSEGVQIIAALDSLDKLCATAILRSNEMARRFF
jgi:hypothetical protein